MPTLLLSWLAYWRRNDGLSDGNERTCEWILWYGRDTCLPIIAGFPLAVLPGTNCIGFVASWSFVFISSPSSIWHCSFSSLPVSTSWTLHLRGRRLLIVFACMVYIVRCFHSYYLSCTVAGSSQRAIVVDKTTELLLSCATPGGRRICLEDHIGLDNDEYREQASVYIHTAAF